MEQKEIHILNTARKMLKERDANVQFILEAYESSLDGPSRRLIHLWAGRSYYSRGDYYLARREMIHVGAPWLGHFFPSGERVIENDFFRFHIMPMVKSKKAQRFIIAYTKNYNRMKALVGTLKLIKKIDVYVFSDSRDMLGNDLCYTDAETLSIYTNYEIKGAHEIIHSMLAVRYGDQKLNDFVNEGVATWYDTGNMSWFIFAHNKCGCSITAQEIEKKIVGAKKDREYYYIAGLTIGYLLCLGCTIDELIHIPDVELRSCLLLRMGRTLFKDIESYYSRKGF
ncbi:MAG: hypothetical protein K6A05_10015 [Lachnospiraceae bacterium]|nr:hypothetical protein [Lachnospiraceae bacterium]